MVGYKTVIIGIALLPLIPAVVAGGGFVIGVLLALAIIAAGLGGPKLWQLHNNKSLGARGRDNDLRDYMSPAESSRDNPTVKRGDGEDP